VPAAIISDYMGLNWVWSEKPVAIGGPETNYTWQPADNNSQVTLIWDIDGEAMKKDLFDTLNGQPRDLSKK